MNLKSCAFTLNRCLVIGQKSSYKKGLCRFTLQTFRLKAYGCELTIMPLVWVSGRDRVVSEPSYDLDGNSFSLPLGIDE